MAYRQAGALRPSHRACLNSVQKTAKRVPAPCPCSASSSNTFQLTTPAAVTQYLAAHPTALSVVYDSKPSQSQNRPATDIIGLQQVHLQAEQVVVEELHAGKINHVFRLAAAGRRPCLLKYAPPYVKSVGANFTLDQGRLRIEARAMQLLQQHCPDSIPHVLHHDEANHVLLMQYLQPPHDKVLQGLHMEGLTYPQLPRQLAELLACTAVYTSQQVLGAEDYQARLTEFANTEVIAANERVVLTEPMDATCPANYTASCHEVQQAVHAFRADPMTRSVLTRLVCSYRTNKEALLHNDLHTGNLLATATSMYCIDWEFASYGPVAFDIGCFIAVMGLAHITLQPASGPSGSSAPRSDSDAIGTDVRASQRAWLLSAIHDLWDAFITRYTALLEQHAAGSRIDKPGDDCSRSSSAQRILDTSVLLQDVLGYTGFAMFRLTAGMHSYPGYGWLSNEEEARCRLRAVKVAHDLLHLTSEQKASMHELVKVILKAG